MNQYIPMATVVVALLLLHNSMPKFVTYFLVLVLILLIINRWDKMKGIFE